MVFMKLGTVFCSLRGVPGGGKYDADVDEDDETVPGRDAAAGVLGTGIVGVPGNEIVAIRGDGGGRAFSMGVIFSLDSG